MSSRGADIATVVTVALYESLVIEKERYVRNEVVNSTPVVANGFLSQNLNIMMKEDQRSQEAYVRSRGVSRLYKRFQAASLSLPSSKAGWLAGQPNKQF